MTIDDSKVQIAKLRRTLFATHLGGAIAILVTWTCLLYFVWCRHQIPSSVVVRNSLGETAELTGDGLMFRSARGTALVWLSAGPRPVLTMGLEGGGPFATVGVETITHGEPFGYLWFHSKGSRADLRLTSEVPK